MSDRDSSAVKTARHRRRKRLGLVRVVVWVKPEDVDAVQAYDEEREKA